MKVFIYSSQTSPRLKYITQFIFGELLGIESEVITNRDEVYTKQFVINYSNQDVAGLKISPAKLLFEKRITAQEPKIGKCDDFITLFHNDNEGFPFDVFSASFYLLSRYEEYLPHKRDKHDRFDPTQSLAFKNGFLNEPVINIWSVYLHSVMTEKYPEIKFKTPKFEFINTIDVDYAFAYLEKGAIRGLGGLVRDFVTGKFSEFGSKISTYLGFSQDPFDTFDFILDLHKKYKLNSIFFFHVGDYDEHDKSIPVASQKLQSLVKGINDYADIGLHPSYASCMESDKLGVEFARLSKLVHQPVLKSRFHFIKLNLPQSYRQLIDNDATEDYTMGYAAKMGFRASVCSPFYFYDLDFNSPTQLRVYPFYLMEATIKYYFNEGPENAILYFKEYIDKVKKYNGTYVSLWHNDSLSEWQLWKGWKKVYVEMIEYAVDEMEGNNETEV